MSSLGLLWTVALLLLAGVSAQEENALEEEKFDKPPPLYPGEVEIFSDQPCPNGLYADPDRPTSPNTKVCVEARLNCKDGVTWQSMCNTCTCSKGTGKLGVIKCTKEDCYDFELPEENLGNSNLCGDDVSDCPDGCGFVRRDHRCVYCQCGGSEPEPEEPAPSEPAEEEAE
ncbi:uncharacterized protein LOC119091065 [Pollicipes pollicipes]|uniref:uncharacterized protein LOC119090951 n=1 Tax=Pollicipes pollicipes TaxID=41117 RepID=UPI0018858649|nr:uncharacterized protein LOC119090951 [Pollicipes pollicipes]XP_037069677.1 uncharacterized protein LOC119091065 [Pollicipes pollicipes]